MVIKIRVGVYVDGKYRVFYFDLNTLLKGAINDQGYLWNKHLDYNIKYADIKLLKPTKRVLFSSDGMT